MFCTRSLGIASTAGGGIDRQAGNLPPDVDSDGMVATALRDLGGEIVDIQ